MARLVFIVLMSGSVLIAGETHLLLPNFLPILTTDVQPGELVYADGRQSIVKLSMDKVARWSEKIHESLGGCGGFIDVSFDLAQGKSPQQIVWEHTDPPQNKLQRPARIGRAVVADLIAGADVESYWNYLTKMEQMGGRSALSNKGKKAAEALKTWAEEHGLKNLTVWTVETEHFFANRQPSVIATLEGSDPSLPAVLIGAHMDTVNHSFGGEPGADDDASGSAVVLESLRVVAEKRARFKRTIHFAWYAAEEWGLIGSKQVAAHFKKEKMEVAAALQFDMVAYDSSGDSEDIYLLTDNTNPDLTATMRTILETYTSAKVGETECGYACSDHASWYNAGVPVAMPSESSFDNMNDRLHTSKDQTSFLDKDHAFRFVQASLAFLGELGELETLTRN